MVRVVVGTAVGAAVVVVVVMAAAVVVEEVEVGETKQKQKPKK